MGTKLTGRVAEGRGVGRRLGYPTANIEVEGAVVARDGVYAAWVWRDAEGGEGGRCYGAMVNIGVKPTFAAGGGRMTEVHLFDFEGDLYGERLAVELVSFVRPERKFSSAEELSAQIAKDKPIVECALAHAADENSEDTARDGLAFERITDTDHPLFDAAWRLYLRSFPPEERRQLRTQRKIMSDAPYHFEIIKAGGAPVGILLWWGFADMRYVEHFATEPRLRGRGYGARALAAFTARSAVPVVLEVELPDTEMSRRRVGFYRRQGFVPSDIPYTHPPYKRGGGRVPLMLMTHPAAITDAQFASFIETHHPVIHRFAM